MKVKNAIKKVGAVAGSALMVGMTMGAAQSLADFPQPFVADDGTVQSQIVVGSQGNQADVVGAINVAAALGQSAVQTETRDVPSGGGAFGWSASSGATLDTRNDNLYFGDDVNKVRKTLTGQDLSVLGDTTFTDDAAGDYEITSYVNVDDQAVSFGNGPDGLDNQDPVLHVTVPAENEVSDTNYLVSLQATTEDINFTDADVAGEDITLFGNEYTIASDMEGGNSGELVLYGSTQSISLSTSGTTSGTVTIDGTDYTIEIDGVNDQGVIYRVDGGTWEQKDEDGEFTVGGETVRIDNVIDRVDDAGSASFEIGSEELHLQDGDVIEDSNGDEFEGTHVEFNGADSTVSNFQSTEVSSIEIFLGAENSDSDYLAAGETFSHSLFQNVEVHFEGLNPAAADGGDAVGTVSFDQSGDEDAEVSFTTAGGDDATINFVHGTAEAGTLGDSNSPSDQYVVTEGNDVTEDEYFFADAGDFDHMYEVTSVDVADSDGATAEDGTVNIKDVVTGNSVEVDVEETGVGDGSTTSADVFQGTEIIDGQKYYFEVTGDDNIDVTWGTGSGYNDVGSQLSVYPALDTASGAAVAFTKTADLPTGTEAGLALSDYSGMSGTGVGASVTTSSQVKLGSNVNGDSVSLKLYDSSDNLIDTVSFDADETTYKTVSASGTVDQVELVGTDADSVTATIDVAGDSPTTTTDDVTATVSSTTASLDLVLPSTQSTDAQTYSVSYGSQSSEATDDAAVTGGQLAYGLSTGDLTLDSTGGDAAVAVIQPEDADDQEQAFVVNPEGYDADDGYSLDGDTDISTTYSAGYSDITLESDDETEAQYFEYGTHTVQDTADQGGFTLHIPDGQAVAGAAVTAPGGSLNKGGSSGGTSGDTYEAVVDQGTIPNMARTDTKVTSSIRSNNHLILVGGPAVNQLVRDLASDGETWTQQQWLDEHDNEALLQVVQDAFTQDRHALIVAGHSEDDTRAAARYISNYADHAQALEDAGNQLVLTEADYPSIN